MTFRLALLYSVATLALAPAALAQDINYGQFEELFGEPVTTSVTGSPQKVSDAPANIEIITQDQIRRSGADNIPDILRYVAGVDVRTNSFDDSDAAIRSYSQVSNPRLLVLVNGRQVYSDDYGRVLWGVIPVQLPEIRQIEVIRGPNTALFGFNAASGVINIITYDPLADSRTAVQLRGGTQNYYGGSAVATVHPNDKIGVRISGGGYHASGFDIERSVGPLSFRDNRSPHEANVSLDSKFKLTSNVTANLEATASQLQHNNLVADIGLFGASFFQTNSVKAGLSADTSYGLLNVTAYRNEQRSDYNFPLFRDISYANVVQVVQASDTFKLGTDHTLRIGLEYRNNTASGQIFNHDRVGYNNYAVSGMWNWQITPSLALTNAVRLDSLHLSFAGDQPARTRYTAADYNSRVLNEVSFNSGLVYKPTDIDTLRFLIGRGIQAPSLLNLGIVGGNLGSPELNAATIMNYEVDYEREVPYIKSKLKVAAFYNTIDNVLSFFPGTLPAKQLIYVSNVGESRSFGGEIGITGASGGWRWNASYSLSKVSDDLTTNQGAALTSTTGFENATPTSTLIAGLGYSWGNLEADVQARWQSSYDSIALNAKGLNADGTGFRRYTINDYVVLSGRIGYKLTDELTLAVTGQQLAADVLRTTVGTRMDRRVLVSLTYTY